MAGIENLKKLSSEEARVLGRKGGIASGEARAKKKKMKEILEVLMQLPYNRKTVENKIKGTELEKENNIQVAILLKQCQKAIEGDLDSVKFIRDTLGENPTQKHDIIGNMNVRTLEDIIKNE